MARALTSVVLSFHAANPSRLRGGQRVPLPPWVMDLLGGGASDILSAGGFRIERRGAPGYALGHLTLPDARTMDADELERQTAAAYAALLEVMEPHGHPVRFWNFVPAIHEPMGQGRDRYMVFNAGRFSALEQRYGGREAFDRTVATASAVGHGGADLIIACLACDQRGEPVDNPRQIKPYHYSQRFGPLPPCFARATIVHPVGGQPLLLTGGTASVRGEESVHVGDLRRQLTETFENMRALLRSAGAPASMEQYHELRVYHPVPADGRRLQEWIRRDLPQLKRLEMVNMDLCRAELLVEIEGVAKLGAGC